MSITSALSNALTGLTASSRSAQVVSSNLANVMTEGYGRREIGLGVRTLDGSGAGVQVTGVTRVVDAAVLRDRRLADAALGQEQGRTAFFESLSRLVGAPDDPASVTGRLAAFEASLTSAISRPDIEARLQGVVDAADGVARTLNRVTDGIQTLRQEADASINRQVGELNTALAQLAELNAQVVRLGSGGRDATALLDQRQKLIDQIAAIVPVREVPRDNGAIALFTTGGAILIDGKAPKIGFQPVAVITPDMTLASGALSGLTLNGRTLETLGSFAPMSGGTLAAAFEVRDQLAPRAQAQIDSVARDIAERLQAPGVDATRAPGSAGLFTDGSSAFDAGNEEGFAARIAVNALVDPTAGGQLWRLRNGLGSAAPGPVSETTLMSGMLAALSARTPPAGGLLTVAAVTSSGLAAELQSQTGRAGFEAETSAAFAQARREGLLDLERRGGVDSDQEMQKLLLIEQSYAANARVIKTVEDLLDILLGF